MQTQEAPVVVCLSLSVFQKNILLSACEVFDEDGILLSHINNKLFFYCSADNILGVY